MIAIQYLKDRQRAVFDSHNRLQIDQNSLLNEISEIRAEMAKLQTEGNELQIAIEKLEEINK